MRALYPQPIRHIYTITNTNLDKVYYILKINNIPIYEGIANKIPNTQSVIIDVSDIIASNLNYDDLISNSNLFNIISSVKLTNSVLSYSISVKENYDYLWVDIFIGDYIKLDYGSDYYTYDYSYHKFLQRKDNYDVIKGASVQIDYLTTGTVGVRPNSSFQVYNSLNQLVSSKTITEIGHYHYSLTTTGLASNITYLEARKENVKNITYNIIDNCNYSGQLYWINNIGGIETIPLIRTIKHRNNYERTQYSNKNRLYSSTSYAYSSFNWETTVSNVKVVNNYTLITPLLTDTDAHWIEEMFSSKYVYFYNKELNKYYSVIISDSEFEYQKISTQRKKIYYTINVKLSKENNY